MDKKMTTKEIVIVAMVGAVIGVLYTLMDYAYMPLSAVLGAIFMELTFGVYLLSASLPMHIVRKPGAAVFGALVTAGVNLLLGSPYGIQLVLAGTLQGIGCEIGYAMIDKYQGTTKCQVISYILAAILITCRDIYFFGSLSAGIAMFSAKSGVRLFSAVVIGIILVKVITEALKKTGVLKGFACAK